MSRQRPTLRLIAAAAVLLAATSPATAQTGKPGAPLEVVVVEARESPFVDRVEALGTTRARETVDLTSSVTEKVVEVRFEDGQEVGAGDVLVALDSAEEAADLVAAQAILEERRLAYERSLQLEQRKFAATAQLDQRRAALREAEAEIQAIQSRIDDRTVRAPFDGVVGLRNISVGALVEPGDMITTLDDIRVIKLDFTVPATYLPSLAPGLAIETRTAAFGDRTFRGTVSSVDSRVDPVTRSIVARALIDNPDGLLRPGLLMTVELLKTPRTSIVVPEEALVPRGQTNTVFVVDTAADNTVVARRVEVGARRPGEVEIRDGLEVGDKVITHGTIRVRPGQKVTMKPQGQGPKTLRELPPDSTKG